MPEHSTAEILQGLGVALDIDDGDLIANAVVIAKVITADGDVGVTVCSSDGTTWLDQLGLVTAAAGIIRSTGYTTMDDD